MITGHGGRGGRTRIRPPRRGVCQLNFIFSTLPVYHLFLLTLSPSTLLLAPSFFAIYFNYIHNVFFYLFCLYKYIHTIGEFESK